MAYHCPLIPQGSQRPPCLATAEMPGDEPNEPRAHCDGCPGAEAMRAALVKADKAKKPK